MRIINRSRKKIKKKYKGGVNTRKRNNTTQETDECYFSMIKWNLRTNIHLKKSERLRFERRGWAMPSWQGSFFRDIKFVSNCKGFVVQKITKKFNVEKESIDWESVNPEDIEDKEYYEIFYIGKDRKINSLYEGEPDGFVQKALGNDSTGSIFLMGESKFYPYDDKVTWENNTGYQEMRITTKLKNLFGEHVNKWNIPDAGMLPSSNKEPDILKYIQPCPIKLIRTINASWHPPPPGISDENDHLYRPEDGWTEVTESVISINENTGEEKIIDLNRPSDEESTFDENYLVDEDED